MGLFRDHRINQGMVQSMLERLILRLYIKASQQKRDHTFDKLRWFI
jgi:hypothetical protein